VVGHLNLVRTVTARAENCSGLGLEADSLGLGLSLDILGLEAKRGLFCNFTCTALSVAPSPFLS